MTGANVGLIVKADGKLALQATGGTASLVLGSGFASATATSVGVSFNNTGAAVASTINISVAGSSVSAPVNVADNVTSVTVTGLSATISEFVTISGDYGFKKDASGNLIIVGNNATARLEVGSVVKVGVTGATLGLLIKADQTFAFQTSNGSLEVNLGSGFATATATTVAVRYNNTGALVNQTLSVAVGGTTISAPVNVASGTTSVVVTGLQAQIGGFVTLSGDMGFKKDATGRLIAAGNNVSATLDVGAVVKAGVTGATVGLIVTSDNKVALQATGGTASLVLGGGFASATATSVGVSYNNTGANVNTTITSASAGISAPINVLNGVTSVTVTGLSATVSEFVTISGDFGFKKDANDNLIIVGNNASARLEVGSVIKAGVTGATLGVLIKPDQTFAFQTTGGSASFDLGSGFATATATTVAVRYNNTGALVNQTLSVTTGATTINAAVNVADGTTSVVVTGLNAQIGGFVTISGDMGFKKDATGRLIAAGNNVSATLDVGSVVKAGVTGATFGLIIKPDNTIALQATGGTASLVLGNGFASATATSVGVSYNNTGADVATTITGTAAGISAPINVLNDVTSVTVTGLNATIAEFVTITGDYGFKKDASGNLIIVGNNASAALDIGGAIQVGVTGATLGLLIKPDQKFAFQTTNGTLNLNLGAGFATATATTVAVRYNNTGADVNQTLSVTTGATTINAAVNVANGTISVVLTGLQAQIGGFVTLSGDMGFKKNAAGRLIAAGNNVSATLDVGSVVKAGVTGATVGLIVQPDGKIALQATGGTASLVLGGGFASATATSVGVSYNNTGAAVNTTITGTAAGISAPINVANNVTSVTVTGLNATISEFVTITGNFGFKKDASGNLIVVGTGVGASLNVGSVIKVGVTNATLGVLIQPDEKIAFQTTNGTASFNLGSGFATATATTLTVRYNNTGTNVNQTLSVVTGATTISAPINVADGTISVVVTGFNAQIAGFVTISGDMGFKKDATGRLIAAGNNVSAALEVGSVVEAGVTGATFGLIITSDNKIALQATGGTARLILGSGFASATATSVGVSYNNTGADVATTITGTAAGISAPINVLNGVTSVTVTGLNATIADFVTIAGDFGFKKDASGNLIIVGNNIDANLDIGGAIQVGVTGATLGLLIKPDQKFALQTSNGRLNVNLGSGFATATATTVAVRYNNTGALVNQTLSVTTGATTISAPVNVATGTTSVVVTGFNAQIAGFVTISGDMGFKKNAAGRLIAAGNNVSATLDVGSVVKAGVTGATFGLIIQPDGKIALQATGGTASLVLGGGFASATATSVGVSYNNTGAAVNTTITGTAAGISAPINVANNVTSVTVTGLNAVVSEFVTITGNFGLKKDANGNLIIAGTNVGAVLTAGSVIKVGVTGATLGVLIKPDQTLAVQTTNGTASFSLGSGFASATATSLAVRYNNTGADVNETLSVTTGSTTISAPVNVADGTISVVVTGLKAQVAGFVTISGDMGFKRNAAGRIIAAGNNVSATLEVGTAVKLGVTGATFGLIIQPDGKIALQATNGAASLSLGNGFASATATSVNVAYNNTGADVNTTITGTAAGISAPINVTNGTTSVVVLGLEAQIANFVTLTGDFGFQKTTGGDLIAGANNAGATLKVGSVIEVGVTGATLGLIIKPTQKIALQATGTATLNLGAGFATATATSVGVTYNNTGAAVNTTVAIKIGAASISAPVKVANNVTSITVIGLNAQIAGFVTLTGDFGFQKSTGGDLIIASSNASAMLEVGTAIKAGVSNAKLGLILKADGKIALQATGTAMLSLGSGFASVTATSVGVAYNNTGADVDTTLSISVSGTTVSAPIKVKNGATAVAAVGVKATIGSFVTLSGDIGLLKDGADLVLAGSNVSAMLEVGTAIKVGVSNGTLGLIIKGATQKIALQASGTAVLSLGSGFASATVTSLAVAYNNTGANVNTTAAVTVGSVQVSAPIQVDDGVTAVVGTGLNAQIAGFVTLTGDFGFQKSTGGDLIIASSNASAVLDAGSVVKAGVSNGTVGLVVKASGKIALQATGAATLNLGNGFATATATGVGVAYNNTGALVNETLNVTIGSTSISAPINVPNGVTAVAVTGLNAQVAEFVTITGDFGFKKTTGGDLIIASSNASATLDVGSVIKVGVSNATLGLIIKPTQKIALQATGSAQFDLGNGFANATATSVAVIYNNTGANVNTTASVTVGSVAVNAPIKVNTGVTAIAVTGLNAQIAGFVTITGDFGFKKTTGGDLIIASSNASALLSVGTVVKAGVTNATLGLLVQADQKIALQATGAAQFNLGNGFASATAAGVAVAYNNTGANVNMTASVTVGSVAVNAPINVNDGVTAVAVTGLNAQIAEFVTLSGDFGFQRDVTTGDLVIASSNASALLSVGTVVKAGVTNATLGLIVKADQKIAFQATGAAQFNLGNGFATATATGVAVAYNNTGVDVNTTASITIGGVSVSAPIDVANGVTAVAVTGLNAQVAEFVTLTGDFGLKKTAGGDLIVVSSNASAVLAVGGVIQAGVTGGTIGVLVKADQKIALQASGAASLVLGSGFASATATSVTVTYNNTGANVNTTASVVIGGVSVSAPINVANGVTSVTVTGLVAQIAEFVTITGNFGFKKSTGGDLIVTGNGASAVLDVGALKVGVTGGTIALLVTPANKVALQASGALVIDLGTSFASASASSVTVAYNNTGVNQNQTLNVGGVSAPLVVADGTVAVSVTGFLAQIADFVLISGNFGFKKTTGGDLAIVASNAKASLTVGAFEVGVSNASLALVINAANKIALQASGTPLVKLPTTLGTVTATSLTVLYNNTGADIDTVITAGTVSAPLKVANGVVAVSAVGFQASIAGFVSVSGNFGFKKTGGELSVAANDAKAVLKSGTIEAGVDNATLALIVKADGTLALQASGSPTLVLPASLGVATATSVTVLYNNTGADVNMTVDIGSVSAPLNVANGVIAVTAIGFHASIANFVTLDGNFGFRKETNGDIVVAATGTSAVLTAGSFEVGVTNATLALVLKSTGKLALQATGSPRLVLPGILTGINAASVTVLYNNTGANINTTIDVGGVSAPLKVTNGTIAVSVTGFVASISDFVTLRGDFGFKRTDNGDISIAASNTTATLTAGSFELGVKSATLGVIIKSTGGIALQASGTPVLTLPGNLVSVKATSVTVAYNNTGADVDTTIAIGTVTAPLKVTNGTIAVTAIGFEATLLNFVTIKGNFGFKKQGADITVAATNASALLTVTGFSAGVKNATLALLIKGDGGIALRANGTPVLTLPTDLTSVINLSITNLEVGYNTTGSAQTGNVTVGSITAPIDLPSGSSVNPFLSIAGSASITIANFITVSGNFGFSRETDTTTNLTKIKIGATDVTGTAGSNEFGLTNGRLGLVIFRNATTNAAVGYALDGSMTGYAKIGGSISAQATVKVRRNTTTLTINEQVRVLEQSVPVVFGSTERAQAGVAYQSIALTDAVIKIGDIVIKGSYVSQPPGPNGESITKITNASLEFGSPALLTLSAAEVTYKAFPAGTRLNGVTYAGGVQQVIVGDGTINFGDVVELFGSFDITRAVGGAAGDLTTVRFSNAGFALKKDGAVMPQHRRQRPVPLRRPGWLPARQHRHHWLRHPAWQADRRRWHWQPQRGLHRRHHQSCAPDCPGSASPGAAFTAHHHHLGSGEAC